MPIRLAIALLFVVSLAPVHARADVHDDAQLFGQQALDDANAATGQMDRQYHKQLVVETFATVPPERRAEAAQDKAGFFKSWMAGRAKALRVNGVYVLICMDPKYVECGAGTETRAKHIFTPDDLGRLRQHLQADLKAKRYDVALTNAVREVADAYAANIPGAKPLAGPPPAITPEPTTAPTVAPASRPEN